MRIFNPEITFFLMRHSAEPVGTGCLANRCADWQILRKRNRHRQNQPLSVLETALALLLLDPQERHKIVSEFEMRNRLSHAGSLLRQGLHLKDVAEQTGFYDSSHLTRFFRRYLGMTPGKFR